MAAPWTTLDSVLAAVAAGMETTPANLPVQAIEKATEALNVSTSDLYEILIIKGYTPDVIVQWDNGATYNLDLAIFWFGTRTGLLTKYDQARLDKLDRRELMKDKEWVLIVNGVALAAPANGAVGGVSFGRVKAVDHLMHRLERRHHHWRRW